MGLLSWQTRLCLARGSFSTTRGGQLEDVGNRYLLALLSHPSISSLGPIHPSESSNVFSLPELKPESASFTTFLQHLSPISKK